MRLRYKLWCYYHFLELFFWLLFKGRNFITNEKLGLILSYQVAKAVWIEDW